jgi:hypothetical protein
MRRQVDHAVPWQGDGGSFPHVFVPQPADAMGVATITEADCSDITEAVQRATADFLDWAETQQGRVAIGLALDGKRQAKRDRKQRALLDRVIAGLLRQSSQCEIVASVFLAPRAVAALTGPRKRVLNGPDETILPRGTLAAYVPHTTGQGSLLIAVDLGFRDLQVVAQIAVGLAVGFFAASCGMTVVGHAGHRLACARRSTTLPLLRSVLPDLMVRMQGEALSVTSLYTVRRAD